MSSFQQDRPCFHGRHIQFFSQLPYITPFKNVLAASCTDPIPVSLPDSGKPGMKTFIRRPETGNSYIVRQKPVDFLFRFRKRKFCRQMNIRPLPPGMNACIRPARSDNLSLLPSEFFKSALQLSLNGLCRSRLTLPALITAPVITYQKGIIVHISSLIVR